MPQRPRRLLGNTREAVWHNQLVDFVSSLELRPGVGYRIIRHPEGGFSLSLDPSGRGGGGLQLFRIKSVPANAEYLACRSWDWTTEGSTDVYIAKNLETRQPASETIAGELWAYTYSAGADSNNQYRTATRAGISESQVVVPYWNVNDPIFAMPASTGVTKDEGQATQQLLTLVAITSRCWARRT